MHDPGRAAYTGPMTRNTRTIPANVSPEAAALLERAYAIDSDAASRALYRDWAETYDATMLEGLRYRSPALVAALLGEHLPDRTAQVLDVGCGTGLAGQSLAELGFELIDGMDISPEMMQVAARRRFQGRDTGPDLHKQTPREALHGHARRRRESEPRTRLADLPEALN